MYSEFIDGFLNGIGITLEEDGKDKEMEQIVAEICSKWNSISKWQQERFLTELLSGY